MKEVKIQHALEQLETIGQRLQPTEFATDASRSEAILNSTAHLAFGPDKHQRANRDDIQIQRAVNQCRDGPGNPGP